MSITHEKIADGIGTGCETVTRSDLKAAYTVKFHYHICWSGSSLDWQAFDSSTEAEAVAKQLVLGDETYTIEAIGGGCKRCLQAFVEALMRQAAYDDAKKNACVG